MNGIIVENRLIDSTRPKQNHSSNIRERRTDRERQKDRYTEAQKQRNTETQKIKTDRKRDRLTQNSHTNITTSKRGHRKEIFQICWRKKTDKRKVNFQLNYHGS